VRTFGNDLALARHIDDVCARFESDWQSFTGNARLAVEDYLGDTPAPHRAALLLELVRLDLHYRLRAGETPAPHDYL